MDISKVKVGSTTYNVKDTTARDNSLHYVTSPSGTAGTKSSNRTIWTGTVSGITSLYTGLTVMIKVPVAGVNVGIVLNINNIGEHPVVHNANSLVTTHYPVGSILILTYDADQAASVTVSGTSTSITGCWKLRLYDSNTTYSAGTAALLTAGTDTENRVWPAKILADYVTGLGYTTNTGTVTGVTVGTGGTNYTPTSGVVTIPAYPTTLPASDVSSWAKASTKPSYAYSEIGYTVNATSSAGGTLSLAGTTPLHVVTLTGNVSALTLSSNPSAGHSCHVILTAAAEQTVAIAHDATNRVCPGAEDISLTVPAGGYVEIDFLNVNSKVYVRGV